MPAKTYRMGPGTLVLGETGSSIEIDCQITSGTITWDVDAEDDVPLLCGEDDPGDETFTATLTGNLFQDISVDGIVPWSWDRKGESVPFEFVPSTAAGRRVVGSVKVRPIDLGGDAKTKPRSDFEWPCVGEPVLEDVTAP